MSDVDSWLEDILQGRKMKRIDGEVVEFVGVDFDGTLVGEKENMGEPIMPMVNRVKEWLAEGMDVRIFTAAPRPEITAFCKHHFGRSLPMTNIKQRGMSAWYDDRCTRVERDTGKLMDEKSLREEITILRRENRNLKNRLAKYEDLDFKGDLDHTR